MKLFRKIKIALRLVPILGEFIEAIKTEQEKDSTFWINLVTNLIRDIIALLIGLGIGNGQLDELLKILAL